MMEKQRTLPEYLQFLTFRIGEQRYGIEVSQIAAMHSYDEQTQARWLWQLLSLSPPAPVRFNIIHFKSAADVSAIIINQPEDIISVPLHQIRPFPRLLSPFAQGLGFWGIAVKEEELLLLLDLDQLMQSPLANASGNNKT
jgi:chemotaxis signal transduction protein